MSTKLTESQHIRNMLEALRYEPPLDPPDEPDYTDHPVMDKFLDPLRSQQGKIEKIKKLSQSDPKAALNAFRKNQMDMQDSIPEIEYYGRILDKGLDERIMDLTDEYSEITETAPDDVDQLPGYLQKSAELLNKVDDLIVDAESELGYEAAEIDRMNDDGM